MDFANYAAESGNNDVQEAIKIAKDGKRNCKKTKTNNFFRNINGRQISCWLT